MKHHLDRTTDSPRGKMCEKMDENINHLVSECNELAQNEQTLTPLAVVHDLWIRNV